MLNDIKYLKVKRCFTLILNYCNKDKYKDNEKVIKYSDFIITNFEYLKDVHIQQFSRFGFTIAYEIFYKNKRLFIIDEKQLINNKNRYFMNKLILSDINTNIHYKYSRNRLATLKEIEY